MLSLSFPLRLWRSISLPSSSSLSHFLVNYPCLDTGVRALVSKVPLGGKALEFGLSIWSCARSKKVDGTFVICVPACVSLVSVVSLFSTSQLCTPFSTLVQNLGRHGVKLCAHPRKLEVHHSSSSWLSDFLFSFTTTTLKLLPVPVLSRLHTLTFHVWARG